MVKKARTPIAEYDDSLAIELPGDGPPHERDRLTDQDLVVTYDRLPGKKPRWRLRGLYFDRGKWTRSGIRIWWAAHEVQLLAGDQLDGPVPEVCRAYDAPDSGLPNILLCHRNTPMVPAGQQMRALKKRGASAHKGRH